MNNNNLYVELNKIAEVLYSDDWDYQTLFEAITGYKDFLMAISDLDFSSPEMRNNVHRSHGKAIATEWAARCVDDLLRTKRFVSGVGKAVADLRKKNSEKPVTILYAGTGPFATLCLPLITRYSPEEVQFMLLEINDISYNSVLNVFEQLNANDYIASSHLEDAVKFKIPDTETIDIVVTECLQHALERESQVAITYNLLPQLNKDTIFIPEEISLHIAQVNTAKRMDSFKEASQIQRTDYIKLNEAVFKLNKKDVESQKYLEDANPLRFIELETEIDTINYSEFNEISIATLIHIYDDERLDFNDSGLTIPKILGYSTKERPVRAVSSQYIIGDSPELKTELLY